jgi:hypothetical protein
VERKLEKELKRDAAEFVLFPPKFITVGGREG